MEKIDLIVQKSMEYLKDRREILFAYIFGSSAAKTAHKFSDIDIAIFINENMIDENDYRYGYQSEILTDLIHQLKTDKVDLVILNSAKALLRHRVIYFGKLVYSKDEKTRVKFQVDTINRYMEYKSLKMKIS